MGVEGQLSPLDRLSHLGPEHFCLLIFMTMHPVLESVRVRGGLCQLGWSPVHIDVSGACNYFFSDCASFVLYAFKALLSLGVELCT